MQTAQLLQRQREVGVRLQRAVMEAVAATDAGECWERAAERRRRRGAGRGCGLGGRRPVDSSCGRLTHVDLDAATAE